MTSYRGLTWSHPRGYRALTLAAERAEVSITWDTHPLEGFESRPIEEIAKTYDLVVLDHPHIGDAVATGVLRPVEDVFGPLEPRAFVGASLASYEWAGKHWALPLDAATQVMALRPGTVTPATWDDVLAHEGPVALSLAGPHALLTFFSICNAFGAAPLSSRPVDEAALDVMARIASRQPAWTKSLNPIGLLEAIADGRDLAVVPLVYGYVGYATKGVAFANAPTAGGVHGSTLGGTGLAITRRCEITKLLVEHLSWLVSDDAQTGFIPFHEGQPSRRSSWTNAAVNAHTNGFFANTLATLEDAWVRPRHRGYIEFQTRGSALVREWLESPRDPRGLLDRLEKART